MPSSEVMSKFKRGKLHSGSKTGKKVTNRKQAIAIMMSEKKNESKGRIDTGPTKSFMSKFMHGKKK